MNVLCINVRLDALGGGGMTERTVQLARSLVQAGARCSILTTDIGLDADRRRQLAGVEITALPCLSQRFYIPRGGLKTVRELVQGADVVHMMGLWNLLNVLAYRNARRYGVPHVVCPAGDFPMFGRSIGMKKLFYRMIGRRIMESAGRVIAITPGEIPHFRDVKIDERNVTVIPNGVCREEFLDRDTGGFRRSFHLGDSPLILFVGRLAPTKGPDLLLEAFCRVKDRLPHHLMLAGPDGGMLAELRQMASDNGVAYRVHFPGFVGGAEKSRAYHAAELLAIPSRFEAMSIVVLEAGCASTPVLLTDRCGFDEVADAGGGRVVAASVDGLAEGLMGMLGGEHRGRLPQMGRRLEQFVSAGYTWNAIVERHIKLFEDLALVASRSDSRTAA